jgi:hypothetical protein
MAIVERIDAVARLGDLAAARAQAHASAGADSDWWELIEQERQGGVVVVALDVSLRGIDRNGDSFQVIRSCDGIWATVPEHLPDLEEELREVAAGVVSELADELRERGVRVREDALGHMFIHVSLSEDLRGYVRAGPVKTRG